MENIFSVFLLSYRKTSETLEELEKVVETLAYTARVPTAFLVYPNFHSCFYLTISLWARDFYSVIVDEGAARVNYRAIEIESE